VLAFVCSNHHLYPIEDNSYIYSLRNLAHDKIVSSKQVVDHTKNKKKDRKPFEAIDTADLKEELDECIANGELPTFSRYDGNITKLHKPEVVLTACEDIEKVKQYCETFKVDFTGQGVTLLSNQLFKKLYGDHRESVMSNPVLQTFRENNKTGFAFTWEKPEEWENVLTLDVKKCYTSILYDNEYPFPVFDVTDNIEVYDGKPLRCGFYWVETENFFPLKRNGLYCYSTLLECRKRGIEFVVKHQVLASYSLPANYFVKYVKETARVEEFKKLNNTMIGFLNKVCSKYSESRITSDFTEAGYFFFNKFQDPGSDNKNQMRQCSLYNEARGLYEVETVTYTPKFENSVPVYQQIVEAGWLKAYDLRVKMGGELMAVKTDAVTVRNPKHEVECDPEGIGTYAVEPNPEKYYDWEVPVGKFSYEHQEYEVKEEVEYKRNWIGKTEQQKRENCLRRRPSAIGTCW
jgi:hypothetical protein